MVAVTVKAFAPIAAVTVPSVSVAAALARPVNVIAPDRSVIGMASPIRLLFWICIEALLSKVNPPEFNSMLDVFSIEASSRKVSVAPERTVTPVYACALSRIVAVAPTMPKPTLPERIPANVATPLPTNKPLPEDVITCAEVFGILPLDAIPPTYWALPAKSSVVPTPRFIEPPGINVFNPEANTKDPPSRLTVVSNVCFCKINVPPSILVNAVPPVTGVLRVNVIPGATCA